MICGKREAVCRDLEESESENIPTNENIKALLLDAFHCTDRILDVAVGKLNGYEVRWGKSCFPSGAHKHQRWGNQPKRLDKLRGYSAVGATRV